MPRSKLKTDGSSAASAAVNKAISPHEVDHIDFIYEKIAQQGVAADAGRVAPLSLAVIYSDVSHDECSAVCCTFRSGAIKNACASQKCAQAFFSYSAMLAS
jgi:hypothetical protein